LWPVAPGGPLHRDRCYALPFPQNILAVLRQDWCCLVDRHARSDLSSSSRAQPQTRQCVTKDEGFKTAGWSLRKRASLEPVYALRFVVHPAHRPSLKLCEFRARVAPQWWISKSSPQNLLTVSWFRILSLILAREQECYQHQAMCYEHPFHHNGPWRLQ
jgi:hypothetical protein